MKKRKRRTRPKPPGGPLSAACSANIKVKCIITYIKHDIGFHEIKISYLLYATLCKVLVFEATLGLTI